MMIVTKPKSGLTIVWSVFSAFLLLFAVSCNQDSIFADIGVEPPRVTALVKGTPTNIVVFKNILYAGSVNSKEIHRYTDGDGWDKNGKVDAPDKIGALAATDDFLYALVTDTDMMNARLVRYDGTTWTDIGKGDAGSDSIQSIYGANGELFVGGSSGAGSIYYVDDTIPNVPTLTKINSINAMLTGVAYDGTDFFVATNGGIYKVDSSLSAGTGPMEGSSGSVKGILAVNGKITAVTYDRRVLLYDDNSKFTTISTLSDGTNYHYTGAMAVWKKWDGANWKADLLLLGVSSNTSYTKGYRELPLDSAGVPSTAENQAAAVPGSERSTITTGDKSKYEASLARYSVNHILQVPGSTLVFASTTLNGLYVLKDGQWNAEAE